jgi:hypothetical protein
MAMWVFRDVKTFDESLPLLSIRLAGYLFLIVMGIIFLHDHAIIEDVKQEYKVTGAAEIMREVGPGEVDEKDLIPISIADIEQDTLVTSSRSKSKS